MDDVTSRPMSSPLNVLIAGGGVAALEAALALNDLAGDRVRIALLAPGPEFVYRPMTVREPFAFGQARRYSLANIATDIGAQLVVDRFAWVDAEQRIAHTASREQLEYDALLLGVGARIHPRFEHGLSIDDAHMDELLHGLVLDVEGGLVKRLAFVVPARMAWPLPIYELALMMAWRAWDMGIDDLDVTLVTPEETPLAIFGSGASDAIARLLEERHIKVLTSCYAEVPDGRHVETHPGGQRLEVDRVIALPELFGPAIRGLRGTRDGFIPVDTHGRVHGTDRVWAAGDATDFAVKHGGVSAQQALAAAQSIAALSGAPITPQPFHPVIRGMLLTGDRPRYLTAQITGGHGFSSQITDEPTWSPPAKISARYLAPYLDELDRAAASR
jgi:sulfide:quinone oxidoreductase